MTYVFKPGDRVTVRQPWDNFWLLKPLPGTDGVVTEWLPRYGALGADGQRADMVRVKLDRHPRALLFLATDVNPI